jgi:deoxycytidine triphosphate deaminase
MAGFVDPGFMGQITFELETARPISVKAGDRIAQLVLIRLTAPTSQPYVGKYLGQQGPTERYMA